MNPRQTPPTTPTTPTAGASAAGPATSAPAPALPTPPTTHRFDDAPGVVGIARHELPPLPDDVVSHPETGRLDPRRWFTEPAHPLEIEIGSGKGTFILAQARANPGTNLLGIETEGEFYGYTADRVRRAALKNVRMLHADATEFIRWRVPDGIVSVIHLYFSDPWPKKKHYKRRVIQDRFLAEAHRVLTASPPGELRVVTDHDELWAWNVEHFAQVTGGDKPLFGMQPFTPPEWVGEGQLVGTNYERKFGAGKPPHACVLVKREP